MVCRAQHELLLAKANGKPWKKNDQIRLFKALITRTALKDDPGVKAAAPSINDVTMYCLRHSHITRQLLAGVPETFVARLHDTSPAMLKRTYAKHILDHSDALARKTLLALGGNVVSLPSAKVG